MCKRLVILLSVFLLAGCGYNDFDPIPPTGIGSVPPNTGLQELVERYRSGAVDLPDGLIIGGVVTSSDSTGNFYKTLIIQEGDLAVGILTGLYDTYVSYGVGEKVIERLDGLRLGVWNTDGVLSVGAPANEPANEPDEIGYIASKTVVQRIMERTTAPQIQELQIPVLRISEIDQANTGQLVRVTGGAFTQGGERTWSGERTYSEQRGTSLTVYTSSYATFADELLPEGSVDLVGIVTMYNGKLQLKINSTESVH